MPELSPSPAINDARTKALMPLIARLGALDLTPILVYRIASLPDSAILAMAWQWDMLSPGWQATAIALGESWDALTDIDILTDIDRLTSPESVAEPSDYDTLRALILQSIPLHSTMGTPAAIINALAAIGWSATLLEGQNSWGGNSWPANEGWAVFRVLIALAPNQLVTAAQMAGIAAAANFFKPARCWLDSVAFTAVPLLDVMLPAVSELLLNIFANKDALSPAPSELINAPAWPLSDTKSIVPLHNDRYYHIGTTYGVNEPAAADSGIVVNGVAVSANG